MDIDCKSACSPTVSEIELEQKSAWSSTISVPDTRRMSNMSNCSLSDFNTRRKRHNYRPLILRPVSLVLVCCFALILIAALEYASNQLPHASKGYHYHATATPKVSSLRFKRQVKASVPTTGPYVEATPVEPIASIPTTGPYVEATPAGQMASIPTTGPYVVATPAEPIASIPTTGPYVEATPAEQFASIPTTGPYVDTNLVEPPASIPTTVLYDSAGASEVPSATEDGDEDDTAFLTDSAPDAQITAEGSLIHYAPKWWHLSTSFIGRYLPILLAIIFKILWSAIYAKVKLIEPFTQMAKPQGAVVADTLHNFYLSSTLTPNAIASFFKGHWLMFGTSFVYMVVEFLAPLASEAFFMDTNYQCANPNLGQPLNPCWPPQLSVNPPVVRLLQGTLAYVAIMTLVIMAAVLRTSTGLSEDPSSIGAVAALMHHPQVLDDFRRLSDEIELTDIRKHMGDRRYRLEEYRRSDGVWRYGFVPVASDISYDWNQKRDFSDSKAGCAEGARKQRVLNTFTDAMFTALLLAVFGLAAFHSRDTSDSGFKQFFKGNAFGPRFFMTATGSIVATNWRRLLQHVQALTPYHRLAKSPATARSTLLIQRSNVPLCAFVSMARHGHFFTAACAILALSSEGLIMLLAGIPYAPGQIFMELVLCSKTSMAILALMLCGIVTLRMWRRGTPELPRAPDTILGVMSYLCASRMLDDFEECGALSAEEFENKIEASGKRYGYGKFVGVDGHIRWMVDEENGL